MAKTGSDNKESDDSDKEYGNRKYSVLTRHVNSKRSKKAWHGKHRSIDCGEMVDSFISVAEICSIKVGRVETARSSQSNESNMEINNHADTKVLGSNFLPVHDFGILVDVYGWDASTGSF